MKKLNTVLAAAAVIAAMAMTLTSCGGNDNTDGTDGTNGADGTVTMTVTRENKVTSDSTTGIVDGSTESSR